MAWPNNVDKSQLRIDYYRGSGPGGQKKNKTSSACRITHIPTGQVASCEESRSQTKNREKAFKKLAKVLVPIMRSEEGMVSIASKELDMLEKIRTYHEKRGQVTDHRTGKAYSIVDIMNGKLEELHKDLMSR